MATNFPGLFAALAAPFQGNEVRVRSQAGRQLQYITARTAMNRLDTVLGPENWTDRLVMLSENSFLCEITIVLPDGRSITKGDVGGMAGMPDAGDDDKSGASDAFKRAAVKFGVGRYLYRDGVPEFGGDAIPASEAPPPPAEVAPPAPARPRPDGNGNGPVPTHVNGKKFPDAPTSGRALFAWVKEAEQLYEVGLLKYLNGWMKIQEFPGRMIDLNRDQVAQCHAEALRKLDSIKSRGDAYEEALAN